MTRSLFIALLVVLSAPAEAREPTAVTTQALPVDSLLAKVGREAVLLSDLTRFSQVDEILTCAGILRREKPLPSSGPELLNAYIDDELVYLEARSRKMSTAGLIPQAVQSIHGKSECYTRWQALGKKYSAFWRTETRVREGESLLVRELEKRVLVEKFRKTEIISDAELWRREIKGRYPVKLLTE